MIVVKVGGSLFDHPALGAGLRAFVDSLAPKDVLLVPGGGPVADAVRELDRVHGLGEEASHWLALRALGVTAAFLEQALEPQTPSLTSPPEGEVKEERGSRIAVLDCFTFAREDESRPNPLPHTWSVTTDSIAARVAFVYCAERLVLLKSVDVPPHTSWAEAAANGWVDAHFPHIAPTLACPIEMVNFRRRLSPRG